MTFMTSLSITRDNSSDIKIQVPYANGVKNLIVDWKTCINIQIQMASEMKHFQTFDDFLNAVEDLLFPPAKGETSYSQEEDPENHPGWDACYARMKEITEELKKEKEQRYEDNEKARGVICELSKQVEDYEGCMTDYYGKATPGDIEEVVENLKDEIDTLAEELQEWKDAVEDTWCETPGELCSWIGASIHEDDEIYSKYMEPLKLREENEKWEKLASELWKEKEQYKNKLPVGSPARPTLKIHESFSKLLKRHGLN